jgi:hypothetical protein
MHRTMPTLRMELFRMYKNATSAMPLPHKLWLMSKRLEPSYRRPALWMPDVDLYLGSKPIKARVVLPRLLPSGFRTSRMLSVSSEIAE